MRDIKYIMDKVRAREYHMYANETIISAMEYRNENAFMGGSLRTPEFSLKFTDENKVKSIVSKV